MSGRVVSEVLRERARVGPETPFLRFGTEPWLTLGELDAVTDRVAAGLARLGVRPGDRVAVLCANRAETVEVLLACARLGALHVAVNYHLRGDFLAHQLTDCAAATLVVDAAGWAMAEPVLAGTAVTNLVRLDEFDAAGVPSIPYAQLRTCADAAPDHAAQPADIVSILYTSGTTGPSKGCLLSNGYFVNAAHAVDAPGYVCAGDRMLSCFPHFHASWQLNTLMPALVNGASIVVEPEFHASTFMRRVADEAATVVWGVATMAITLLAQPESPQDAENSLRLCIWATLDPDLQLAFEDRFGCRVIAEAYGQSEAVPITIEPVDTPTRRPFAEGRASSLYEVQVVDLDDVPVAVGEPGEIVVRPRMPHAMFSGYWNNPEATVRAFRNLWHHTGDLGRMDDDGRLYFVDRLKDAVRRRGENVSCVELETTIARHPRVTGVAVTGVPSPLGDEDIKVSLTVAGSPEESPDSWFDWFRQTLPYFAVPRYLEIRGALPRTPTGKVRKDVLRGEGVHDALWDLEAMGLVVARADRRG